MFYVRLGSICTLASASCLRNSLPTRQQLLRGSPMLHALHIATRFVHAILLRARGPFWRVLARCHWLPATWARMRLAHVAKQSLNNRALDAPPGGASVVAGCGGRKVNQFLRSETDLLQVLILGKTIFLRSDSGIVFVSRVFFVARCWPRFRGQILALFSLPESDFYEFCF